jgi:ribosomal protein S18 acetylase RimI-like enzyme
MSIEIRKLTESDLPAVFELMAEFAEYEKLQEYLSVDSAAYVKAMFGPDAFVEGLIAVDGDSALGYAIFYPCFATFRSMPGMFLEDLFVSAKARGTGLGDKMIRAVAKRAKDRGFERMDLHVLDWNAPAIDFYRKRGADVDSSDLHFRFVDEAFRKLAE